MKRIEIVGQNYKGFHTFSRTTCRAIIIENNKILLSYETMKDQYMIPGGGMEENENDSISVIREVQEETGFIIKPSEFMLEIDEYYGQENYLNKYCFAEIVGKAERKLTPKEIEAGMEPRWVPVDEAIEIFSHYQEYEEIKETKTGMYLREYTALIEFLKGEKR